MEEHPIEEIKYRGFLIKIYHDDCPLNPRVDFDNLGFMVCFHNKYRLGDNHAFSDPQDFSDFITEEGPDNFVILSLWLYDHSGITISTSSFSCPWDSGQIGWIYVSKDTMLKEFGYFDKDKAKGILEAEVKEYDYYIRGAVFGYRIEPKDTNKNIYCDDSCWGFFGYDWEKNGLLDEAKPSIDYSINKYKEEVKENKKRKKEIEWFMKNC